MPPCRQSPLKNTAHDLRDSVPGSAKNDAHCLEQQCQVFPERHRSQIIFVDRLAIGETRLVAGNVNHAWNRLDDSTLAKSQTVTYISVMGVPELSRIKWESDGRVTIGAATSLTNFLQALEKKRKAPTVAQRTCLCHGQVASQRGSQRFIGQRVE